MHDPLSEQARIESEQERVRADGMVSPAMSAFLTLVCDLPQDEIAVLATARMLDAASYALYGDDETVLGLLTECGPVSRTVMSLQAFDLAQNHAEIATVREVLLELALLGDNAVANVHRVLLPCGHTAVRDGDETLVQTATLPSGYLRTVRSVANQLLLPRPDGAARLTALCHLAAAAPVGDDEAQIEVCEAVVRVAAWCFMAGDDQDANATARLLRSEADGWRLRTLLN